MEKSNAKKIAFYGVMSALMFVFLLTETYILSVFYGNITPTFLTIPLAVALSLFSGKRGVWVGGTIFGCCSFFLAICISNPIFINPLISIFPRVFIGVVAFFVYSIIRKLFKNEVVSCSLAGIFGVFTNSVCTIFMMWVFSATEIATILTIIISLNFIPEIIVAAILCPIYVKVFKRMQKRI